MASAKIDVVSRTISAALVFVWLLAAHSTQLLLSAFMLTLCAAAIIRVKPALVAFALFVPVLPILISYFGIEPYFSHTVITNETKLRALQAWLRLGGMAVLSISWFSTLDLVGAAQLCRLLFLGQYLLLPLQTAATFIKVTRDRWTAIREFQALRRRGRLSRRTRVSFARLPGIGLQLTLASLISSSELALACQGRGVGSRRHLAVPLPRLSFLGLALVISLGAVTFIIFRYGLT